MVVVGGAEKVDVAYLRLGIAMITVKLPFVEKYIILSTFIYVLSTDLLD